MTSRIGAKGQVVIPKELRRRTGIHPGTEVDLVVEGERVVIAARRSQAKLGGRFDRSGMAARLVEDRAREPR